jgi:hypothetical protein
VNYFRSPTSSRSRGSCLDILYFINHQIGCKWWGLTAFSCHEPFCGTYPCWNR